MMASDLALEKGGAMADHQEISEKYDGGNGPMGTTQLNESEEILLVPAPSADPRGEFMHAFMCNNAVD